MDNPSEMKIAVRLNWDVIRAHSIERKLVNLTQTLADVGERAAIREITSVASSRLNGDDAAVLPSAPPNSRTVAATDLMLSLIHI